MLQAQIISDIHLNHQLAKHKPKKVNPDSLREVLFQPIPTAPYLILPGDLWEKDRFVQYAGYSWIADVAKLYEKIYVVLGNHDYYQTSLGKHVGVIKQKIKELGLNNVFLLENEAIQLDDGSWLWGATYWTDLKKVSPADHYTIEEQLMPGTYRFTDFGAVKAAGYQRLRTRHWIAENLQAKNALSTFLNARHADETVHVLTHFPLIEASCDNMVKAKSEQHVYLAMECSDLGDWLASYPCIKTHIHGHLHQVKHYEYKGIQTICNPYGYEGSIQQGDNPELLLPFNPDTVFTLG